MFGNFQQPLRDAALAHWRQVKICQVPNSHADYGSIRVPSSADGLRGVTTGHRPPPTAAQLLLVVAGLGLPRVEREMDAKPLRRATEWIKPGQLAVGFPRSITSPAAHLT